MISQALADEIRRLLAARTQSMRRIARITGTSRGTVAAIAHGRRRERLARQPDSDSNAEEPQGPIERCPECGALTHAPCRACRVRKWMRARGSGPPRQPREEPLQVELTDEFRQRYEEVRARRIREGCEDD